MIEAGDEFSRHSAAFYRMDEGIKNVNLTALGRRAPCCKRRTFSTLSKRLINFSGPHRSSASWFDEVVQRTNLFLLG